MIITLAEAKEYLRVDTDDEDALITTLMTAAQNLCEDVSRLETADFESAGDVAKIAVLFTLGYFFEHREDNDAHKLTLNLRSLLSGIRRQTF